MGWSGRDGRARKGRAYAGHRPRAERSREGHPFVYERQEAIVRGRNNRKIAVEFYMMTGRPFGVPSDSYYETIRVGYRQHKFKIADLDDAVMNSIDLRAEQQERWTLISEHRERLDRDRASRQRSLFTPVRPAATLLAPRRPARVSPPEPDPSLDPELSELLWASETPSWRRERDVVISDDLWGADESSEVDFSELETSGIRISRGQ
jgi:hypothetical protein